MLASAARPDRRPRRGEGARRGDRRRGAGRAGRRGLRRVRGAGRAGAREQRARRSGRHQLAHRELPRLSHRHLRPGARRARPDAGREVRRRGGDRPHRRPPRLRQPALSPQPLRRAGGAHAHHRHRHRREVPEARRCRRSQRFEGAGVYYCATYLESQLCKGEEIAIVGGGNSAGQAAVFLAGVATRVHMLVRGPGLAESMSRYLIQRIESTPNVVLRTRTQVEALEGEDGLERVRWRHVDSGERETARHPQPVPDDGRRSQHRLAGGLRRPRRQEVREDRRRSAARGSRAAPTGRCPAAPTCMETSIPGVFCVGDARSTSVKRVASAVGEGSICVQLVHRALAEL